MENHRKPKTDLDPIKVERRSGNERFIRVGEKTQFELSGFWAWSSSDLLSNAQRGILAEYIVACDLGIANGVRQEWDAYDLETQSGITVEVKSAAYLQSWKQTRLSDISFSIAPSHAWNPETNTYEATSKRQADVYVFCLLTHQDKATIDPLNLDQWRFYVVPTTILNERFGKQKRVSLNRLLELKPKEVQFGQIGDSIELLKQASRPKE